MISQSFPKHFETIRDKTLKGEVRNSFPPTSTRRVRTEVRKYGDVITKFSRMGVHKIFLGGSAVIRSFTSTLSTFTFPLATQGAIAEQVPPETDLEISILNSFETLLWAFFADIPSEKNASLVQLGIIFPINLLRQVLRFPSSFGSYNKMTILGCKTWGFVQAASFTAP